MPRREIEVIENPLYDLIDDETFEQLRQHRLLNERGIRDYIIRRTFRQMRDQQIPAAEAIERLREEYPYLQYDTIRKIVYGLH